MATSALFDTRMRPGDQLDGYTILRRIGRGGYGEVWLCRAEATGEFRAMKFIAAERPDLLEKEFRALANYRKATFRLRSQYLIPIEHIGNNEQGLYYVMPVADGTGNDPADPDWRPLTLALLIEQRSRAETWFSCEEIAGWMRPVLEALQTLTDAGFVHRDVKPDNILIIGGQPTLGDIGLMDEDHATLSRRGTPGYLTPSWYKAGHPDMYGAAATLYTLLTGNLPDRMGRSAFNAPPQGDASLNALERSRRAQFHAVIRRAADERPAERYRDFRVMREALSEKPRSKPLRRILSGAIVAVMLFVAAGAATLGLPKPNGLSWVPKEEQAVKTRTFASSQVGAPQTRSLPAPAAQNESGEILRKTQLQRAEELFSADDAPGGLAYLATVLRSNPADRITGQRLLSALRDRSYARPLTGPWPHPGSVFSVAWSPDGRHLVAVTKDHIYARNTTTGQLIAPPIGASQNADLRGIRFSPDGSRFVVIGTDFQVFDTATLKPICAALVHKDRAEHRDFVDALFLGDGSRLVTAAQSNKLTLWNIKNGNQLAELKMDSFPEGLALHPKGIEIAVRTQQGTILLWDTLTQRIERTWPGTSIQPGSIPRKLVFSQDGKHLFATQQSRIERYDLSTGQQLLIQLNEKITAFDLSPDGHTLAVATASRAIRFFSADSGEDYRQEWPQGTSIESVEYAGYGTRLVCRAKQVLRVRDVVTGIPVCSGIWPGSDVECASASPDGRFLAVGTATGEVKLWEVAATESRPVLFESQVFFPRCVINPKATLIATSQGSTVCVSDFVTGRRLGLIDHGEAFWAMTFHPEHDILLTGGTRQMRVRIWDCLSGRSAKPDLHPDYWLGTLQFPAGGDLLYMQAAAGGGAHGQLWNFKNGQSMAKLGDNLMISAITPDGQRIVAVDGKTYEAKLFDVASEQCLSSMARHNAPIQTAGSASPNLALNSQFFATGSSDGRLRVWRTQDGSPVTPWLQHQGGIVSVDLSSDGSLLAAASDDAVVRIWSVPDGKEIGEPIRHSQPAIEVRFCPDNRRLATTSQDGSVRIWDAQTGRPLSDRLPLYGRGPHYQAPIAYYLVWSSDGSRLVGGGSGMVLTWETPDSQETPPVWLADWAEAVGGKRLDQEGRLEKAPEAESERTASRVATLPGDDLYVRTAKWFYSPPHKRPTSPESTITPPEYAKHISEADGIRTVAALLRFEPGNARAWGRYVELAQNPDLSSFLDIAETIDPEEPWVWRARAAIHHLNGESERELAALRHSAELDPEDWRTQQQLAICLSSSDESAALAAITRALAGMESSGYNQVRRKLLLGLRVDLLRRLNRTDESIPDVRELYAIAPRNSKATSNQIDLSAYYTQGLGDDPSFYDIPHGLRAMDGLVFDIRGLVQIGKPNPEQEPSAGVARIQIDQTCSAIHFLHTCRSIPSVHGVLLANYVLTYDDGTIETIPVRAGIEIGNLYRSDGKPPPPPLKAAWIGETADTRRRSRSGEKPVQAILYRMTWQNPHAEKQIRSLDLIPASPNQGSLVLFAVTLE